MGSPFFGFALCVVEADGHVRLPEFLADILSSDSDRGDLLLSTHEADQCLVGYGRDHLPVLRRRTEQWRRADEAKGRDARAHHRRARRCFGLVEAAPMAAGAIRIPPAMRHLGQIESLALFVGAGDRFEIWNPRLAIASGGDELRDVATYRLEIERTPPRRRIRHGFGRTNGKVRKGKR